MRRVSLEFTRNFSIVAHIDHGKSTLADRILEVTHSVSAREMRAQLLDSMDLERERGITIKAQAVRVLWEYEGDTYTLNLIDTPGHVDFTYEVSRSLAACEGALLVVDAAQGLEAQTLANAHLAIENDLEIVPVLNKIDLPAAEPDRRAQEVADFLGGSPDDVLRISAKTGLGVAEVLDAIVERIPPPEGDRTRPGRALVFDSTYDQYRGVVAFVRVVDGTFRTGQWVRSMGTENRLHIEEIGVMTPAMLPTQTLSAGEVGYIVTGIKSVSEIRVGDTLTDEQVPACEPLPGYVDVKPMVFAGLFPTDADQYPDLRDALERLKLNDGSLFWEPETSQALGFGFRCGFLGPAAHGDRARAARARVRPRPARDDAERRLQRAHDAGRGHRGAQPVADARREPHRGCRGAVRARLGDRAQGVRRRDHGARRRTAAASSTTWSTSPSRACSSSTSLPLAEIVLDFYDQLKSRTRGYAAFDYELDGFRSSHLVKLDILLNGEPVDALSMIVHRDKAYPAGKVLVDRLRGIIPRQMFDVPIQASIGSRIIARETIKARRKDVLAKCYGGDVTRKRKLLEKQKKGKKRMKQVGSVEVPQEAFLAVLSLDGEK